MHFGNPTNWTMMASLSMLLVAGCSSAPRIDGTSAQAFDSSYAKLLGSLGPEERFKLALAQLVVLAPTGCLASSAPESSITRATGVPEADIRPCREQLHGMTYQDIMGKAYP